MHGAFIFLIFLLVFVFIFALGIFLDYGETTNVNLEDSTKFFQTNQRRSDIIVSFTTMPQRLQSKSFMATVCSLLNQDTRPKEIRINIPYTSKRTGETYEIPKWLEAAPVTIHRCEDQGPATKYISTLRDYANTEQKILVCDDDSPMARTTITQYDILCVQYPNHVLTAFGNQFDRIHDKNGKLTAITTNPDVEGTLYTGKIHWIIPFFTKIKTVSTIQPVDLIYGLCGYVLQANMVDVDELTDYDSMPKEAFFVDDVVISGHLASRNVPRIVAHGLNFTRMTHENALHSLWGLMNSAGNKEALSLTVNRSNHNNESMINYFFNKW